MTVADNKAEIDKLTTELADNKAEIDKLTTELATMKTKLDKTAQSQSRRKLPARVPEIYKRSDLNFRNYVKNLACFFQIRNVPVEERSRLLLTFLDTESFMDVTRIYPADTLATEEFDTVVDKIAGIVSEQVSEAAATTKLMRLKQGGKTMGDFIRRLEYYAELSFPDKKAGQAKKLCMISALIAGCRSKVLSYEISMFKKNSKDKELEWNEIVKRAVELDLLLSSEEDDGGQKSHLFNIRSNNNMQRRTKTCFGCGSPYHLISDCTEGDDDHNPIAANASNTGHYSGYEEAEGSYDNGKYGVGSVERLPTTFN
jgi:hypothetical protein